MRYEHLLIIAKKLRGIDGSMRGLQLSREKLLAELTEEERAIVVGVASTKPPRKRKPIVRRSRSEAARNRKNKKTEQEYRRLFWSQIAPQPSGCWLWTGVMYHRDDADPRGRFTYHGKGWGAHRLAYFLHHGVNPGQLCVLHRCDVSLCVNPEHLLLGTQLENVADMDRKGRRVSVRGERVGCAKLTADQVVEIRRRVDQGEGYSAIARELEMDPTTIRYAAIRKTWRHVA